MGMTLKKWRILIFMNIARWAEQSRTEQAEQSRQIRRSRAGRAGHLITLGLIMIEIEAEVIHGKKIGRALGFPTANMTIDGHEDIERGVYRSSVVIDGTTYKAMSNIGIRPSVGGKEVLLETHVIGFKGDLYGRRLRVTLIERIRDEKRFASISDLKEQLQRDYELIRHHD